MMMMCFTYEIMNPDYMYSTISSNPIFSVNDGISINEKKKKIIECLLTQKMNRMK
jgi:hypothetical protein